MAAAWFYHLTRSPVETTLATLLPKALGAGWQIAVRGTDRGRLERLDEVLWNGDGFLPHGLAGGPHDADQPVLLTTESAAPNGAACLFAVDGAEVGVEEAQGFERVCLLFEGADPEAVEAARGQWRRLTEAGVPAVYWSEESGTWAKKAESGPV
ncbi:MAG: DNA polymerase III subunit chi [Paracoccaceae bacterium]|nr:DNA polymerase III subunit chi [Paracoccaceae bacterium]